MNDSSSSDPSDDIIEKAAYWAALIDAGDMGPDDQAACEQWCASDPLHRKTLDRMRSFDERVAGTSDFERDALDNLLSGQRSRRLRTVGGSLIGILAILSAGWAAIQSDFVRDHFPDYETQRGEVRAIALDDGSTITLDTDGAARVHLGRTSRQIRLIRGRLLANVSKDKTRPFIVETAHGTAMALGTSFMVQQDASGTQVSVLTSHVRVCPAHFDDATHCLTLGPGQQAMMDGQQVHRLTDTDPEITALWTTGWLEADDREVADVLTELNRYIAVPVRFDATSLRGLRVTGSFPLKDVEQALAGLARTAPLDIHRASDGTLTVERRRQNS